MSYTIFKRAAERREESVCSGKIGCRCGLGVCPTNILYAQEQRLVQLIQHSRSVMNEIERVDIMIKEINKRFAP